MFDASLPIGLVTEDLFVGLYRIGKTTSAAYVAIELGRSAKPLPELEGRIEREMRRAQRSAPGRRPRA